MSKMKTFISKMNIFGGTRDYCLNLRLNLTRKISSLLMTSQAISNHLFATIPLSNIYIKS